MRIGLINTQSWLGEVFKCYASLGRARVKKFALLHSMWCSVEGG